MGPWSSYWSPFPLEQGSCLLAWWCRTWWQWRGPCWCCPRSPSAPWCPPAGIDVLIQEPLHGQDPGKWGWLIIAWVNLLFRFLNCLFLINFLFKNFFSHFYFISPLQFQAVTPIIGLLCFFMYNIFNPNLDFLFMSFLFVQFKSFTYSNTFNRLIIH